MRRSVFQEVERRSGRSGPVILKSAVVIKMFDGKNCRQHQSSFEVKCTNGREKTKC